MLCALVMSCSCCRLYAVGGRDGSSCLRPVECFYPHTNRWSLCACMSQHRGGVGVRHAGAFCMPWVDTTARLLTLL